MKNNNEIDPVKEAIRRKMVEMPLYSDKDKELWNRVLSEIEEEPKVFKINYAFLYAAATILLFITVSLGYFIGKSPKSDSISNEQVSALSPDEKNNSQEKEVNKSGKESVFKQEPTVQKQSGQRVKSSSIPDFNPVQVIHTENHVMDHKLPDGSVATLNSGSTIKTNESFKNQRNLVLEGEAYFEVKSDKESPFTVYFSDYKLVVVGTKFNVRSISSEKGKEVTVTEGVVRVFDNIQKEGIEVKQGEQLKLSKGEESILLQVDSPNYISWKTGSLNFRKTGLGEVINILSRKYKTEIAFSPEVKNCKFTGDLTGLELDEILIIISKSLSLKVETIDNKIYVTGPGCN